jgi:hypothetical protein
VKPVFLLGCYGCIFHGTGNSAQLCQNFGILGAFGTPLPHSKRTASHCEEQLVNRTLTKTLLFTITRILIIIDYNYLWLCSPALAMASSFHEVF